MGKIQKFVKKVKYDKHFIVYVYSDSSVVVESMLIGPKYIVIITAGGITEEEVDNYINKFFESNLTCMRCRSKYSNYFRVEIKPNVSAVCGECGPTVKFAVKYFELIDLIIPL
jgi:translation initiation factor 2 beta subunit (eIF-2beta)/eIF-5